MSKLWLVALHEYRRHVFNRRFIFGLLSVPLVIVLLVGLIFLIIAMENNTTPIGYVDYSGLLSNPLPAPKPTAPDRPVPMIAFANETDAQSALDAGRIQAYYVLPADYRTTGALRVVHINDLKAPASQQFYHFLGANLLKGTDPAIASRLVKGADVTVQSADGSRSLSSNGWFSFVFPMIAGVGFIIAMFTAGGYLMQAVVEEKENRTMEVIITSVSPNQFMAGKIVGDTCVGLTQILAWLLLIIIPILVERNTVTFLQGIQVSSQTLAVLVFTMLPSFVLVAISGPLVPRLRRSRLARAFLDGVNVALLALLAVVTWQLARIALVDWLTISFAVAAAVWMLCFRVNSTWLILGGAALGLARFVFQAGP